MQPVIYDVAVSADGFIAGAGGDISLFAHEGATLEDYIARLATYAHCLMGRATYEFGYRYGLEPGANPYPTMQSTVFSSSLKLPEETDVVQVQNDALAYIDRLQQEGTGPIYLCGGGAFAGYLLQKGRIDMLRLKRAPILLGDGTPLFEDAQPQALALVEERNYGCGALYQAYRLGG